MKIKKMILKNFRSHLDTEIDFNESLNVIVGKNDVGKSSILEALGIFLGEDYHKVDISDLSIHAESKFIEIRLIFSVDPDKEYSIDTKDTEIKTTLRKEYLLNADGDLEIVKRWDCKKDKITVTSLQVLVNANYFNQISVPLITLKNSELKKILEEKNKTCDKRVNSNIREVIYESYASIDLSSREIEFKNEDSAKLWNSIKKELPIFFLFQSDRSNRDSDKDVQDPLKAITKQAIASLDKELEAVKRDIDLKIQEMSRRTIEKLHEMSPEIANQLKTEISHKPWDSLFSFSFLGDDNIPLNKRGSGVRRLILLNYFRAQAELKQDTEKDIIYAIEEPETAQHPNHQVMLINALNELAQKDSNQLFVTTHSPEIAKLCSEENLIYIKADDNKVVVENDSERKLYDIAETLGTLPYISKFSIFLEGETDVRFLKTLNKNIDEFKTIIDLDKETKIKVLPLFGSCLKSWIDKGYIEGSNIKGFYLFDKDDDEKYKSEIESIKKNGSEGFLTEKLMMENYFSPSLIEKEFNIKISEEDKDNWDEINIIDLVLKYDSSLNKDKKTKKYIKDRINGSLLNSINKNTLNEVNAFEEIQAWFQKICELYSRA